MNWHELTWIDMNWHELTWFDMTYQSMSFHVTSWHNKPWLVLTWYDMFWHVLTWVSFVIVYWIYKRLIFWPYLCDDDGWAKLLLQCWCSCQNSTQCTLYVDRPVFWFSQMDFHFVLFINQRIVVIEMGTVVMAEVIQMSNMCWHLSWFY